jgi:hypothetical protein
VEGSPANYFARRNPCLADTHEVLERLQRSLAIRGSNTLYASPDLRTIDTPAGSTEYSISGLWLRLRCRILGRTAGRKRFRR